ncbi:MAG: GTP-binding protein, partial [Bacteroidetes bacterium]
MLKSKKIVLVGHFGVGKSSLIRRYVQNVFSDDYFVTVGVHIVKKVVQVNNQELTLLIWDIEGKEDMKKLRPSFLLGTSGFIYVLDASRPSTYEILEDELDFIRTNYPKTELVTVANKIDLVDKESF